MEIKDFPGIIPKFYEVEACIRAGYRYHDDWKHLSLEEKATIIAHFYLTNLVDSHKNEVVVDQAKKDQKKKKKGAN